MPCAPYGGIHRASEGALKGLERHVAPAYGPYCLEAVRTWDQTADTQGIERGPI